MGERDPKAYLEYLDKEMTIMGILSTFCVLVAGLTVNGSLGADRGELKNVWTYGQWYLLSGSTLMLLAALLFYRQRSLLAYYYGQISLCHVQGSSGEFEDLESALADADAWITWYFYQCAFASVVAGFLGYGLALLSLPVPIIRDSRIEFGILVLVASALGAFARWNHKRLSNADEDSEKKRHAGWLAKPSKAVRARKRLPANKQMEPARR